nr:glucosyltransferase domain-containing protein [Lysinibacillus timonensis]
MPEKVFEKLKQNIKSEWILAFNAAMIIGILTHLYVFMHRYPNHDGLHNLHSSQAMVTSGRFFLSPAAGISSYFDLPWVIGLFSIFFLALAAVSLVSLFEIRKKVSIILISGIVVTFPSVSSTFSYMFTADGYMLGIFMAIFAVLLTKKYKKFGFLLGAVLVCLSVGVYQANLSVVLTFTTFWLIHEIIYTNSTLKQIWANVLRSGLMVGIGMIGYLVVYKLFTSAFAVEISTYQGLDKVGSLTLADIPRRISQIMTELKTFFFRGIFTNYSINFLEILNVLLFIILIVGVIVVITKKQLYKNIGKLATLLIGIITLPFSYYIAYFMSPSVFYHMLMVFGLSSVYIFVVLMYDKIDDKNGRVLKVEKITSWATVIVIAFTIFNFGLIANIAYMNMELRYEKSINVANRLIDRIEQLDEYESIEKIAVFGNVKLYSKLTSEIIPNETPVMTGSVGEVVFYKHYSYQELIDQFLGYSLELPTDQELAEISQSEQFKEMSTWPAKDSVKVIGNTVVIKFEEIETN